MLRLLLVAGCLGLGGPGHAEPETLSLLAFGDTGKPVSWPTTFVPQYRVGEAMAREDRRAPVDALLLLGDIFYPDGLTRRTLRDRMRMNLAGPYCHFLSLTQKGRQAARSHCDRDPEQTHPVPILAVTGNHDLGRGQGVRLQRERLPVFLENWLMPADARSYELGAGLSVIGFHSDYVKKGMPATALAEALRESKGPWRIVIAHHPIADPGKGWDSAYAQRVRDAIAAAGHPVHLFLAGHEHSLQALRAGGAALHVVSGAGGAGVRPITPTRVERLYGEALHGFVRLHVSPEALDVTFLALDGTFDRDAEPRARFRVAPDGTVTGDLRGPADAGRAAGRAGARR
ncbi:MAG: metallophosphoesterase [Myxococcota bacterium]